MSQPLNLKKRVRQYLRERRRLGFQLRSMGYALRGFADYVDKLQPSGALTVELMAEWAKCDRAASKDPRTWARRLKILRPFMRWLQQFESGTEVPDDAIFGRAGERLAPHIFSEREIVDLLAAARRLEPDLRGVTYETLFGLLAATGLRVSEAVGLSNSDVDLKTGMLTVQRTKFAKSRQVPVHPSTLDRLRRYRRLRDPLIELTEETPFFVGSRGRRRGQGLSTRQVDRVFAELCIPRKLDTDSTANWTAIPREPGQSERSDAGLKGFTLSLVLWSSFWHSKATFGRYCVTDSLANRRRLS